MYPSFSSLFSITSLYYLSSSSSFEEVQWWEIVFLIASEVETGIGFVMEAISYSSSSSIVGNYSTNVEKNGYLSSDIPVTDDTLPVDDLLDFSTQDDTFDDHLLPQSSVFNLTSVPSLPWNFPLFGDGNGQISYNNDNSSQDSGSHLAPFPDDLCIIPSEEAAELEWLSKFVEESFSDMPFSSPETMVDFANIIPSSTTNTTNSNSSEHYHDAGVFPGHAMSKKSRPSELLSSSSSSSSSSDSKKRKGNGGKNNNNNSTMTMVTIPGAATGSGVGGDGGIRKCTHCSSEKTPQWRTGPLGPKTLCNACGVRYKSGRLVPEYRPASSPTFVLSQHSNSHRKVMELRRKKEVMLRHQSHQYHRKSSPPTTTTTARSDLSLRNYEVC